MREHETKASTYVLNWVALVVLTTITFFLSRVSLGGWQVPAALLIAVLKGGLVVLIFMHLREQRAANRFFLVVPVLFIVLLVSLTTADMLTR